MCKYPSLAMACITRIGDDLSLAPALTTGRPDGEKALAAAHLSASTALGTGCRAGSWSGAASRTSRTGLRLFHIDLFFRPEGGLHEGKLHVVDELARWYRFWKARLDERSGLEAVFRKYRKILLNVHQDAAASGFEIASIYIMLDVEKDGSAFFKDNVAFVMESLPWWEASYPGEPYDLSTSGTQYYRRSYHRAFGGQSGFHHNPVSDPERWYLPRFDTDRWGTWFSGWRSRTVDLGSSTVYTTFNIDFDAATVQQMMISSAVQLFLIAVLLIMILLLATRRFGTWLTRPIDALTRGAEAVMERRYDYVVPIFGNDEFSRLTNVFNKMIQWVKEMANLKETLTKLLSAELAEKAAREGLVLGGQKLTCTIMFTDFAGFSTLTRNMRAETVVTVLNRYFAELIGIIKKYGGFPDKFIGDAIVAIFGAPVRFENHAEQAVRCSIELQQRMRELNARAREQGEPFFEMRVGLNSGEVLAGAIGCDLKLEYTSIGETTNLANRMEAKCKIGHVLISENTRQLIDGLALDGVVADKVPEKEMVKGYREPVNTYNIYVHNLRISKNTAADRPANFYVYDTLTFPACP